MEHIAGELSKIIENLEVDILPVSTALVRKSLMEFDELSQKCFMSTFL